MFIAVHQKVSPEPSLGLLLPGPKRQSTAPTWRPTRPNMAVSQTHMAVSQIQHGHLPDPTWPPTRHNMATYQTQHGRLPDPTWPPPRPNMAASQTVSSLIPLFQRAAVCNSEQCRHFAESLKMILKMIPKKRLMWEEKFHSFPQNPELH